MNPPKERYWLHLLLFVATLASTAYTGTAVFVGRDLAWAEGPLLFGSVSVPFIRDAVVFSFGLLGFLTVHEFGHYVAARVHRIGASLPYYIPTPLIGIGTLGALIRIRQPIPDRTKLFDIGASGPLAGFLVALALLVVAMSTLPPPEFMLGVSGHEPLHRYIAENGAFPTEALPGPDGNRLTVGMTPLYWVLSQVYPNVPPMHEMYHYPLLFAAWLGLFFTALNLLPVGQLDGGHILYALMGRSWHGKLARVFIFLMACSTSIGMAEGGPEFIAAFLPVLDSFPVVPPLIFWFLLGGLMAMILRRLYPKSLVRVLSGTVALVFLGALAREVGPLLTQFGYGGWLLWCFLLVYFIKVDHPCVEDREPLTRTRKVLGIVSLAIFLLCFSIRPLYFA